MSRPGELRRIDAFPARAVPERPVTIWLPPGYGETTARYPVIYAQDGQNLFDPSTAFVGVDWGLDLAMGQLLEEGTGPAIIVGIWNTPDRYREYDCTEAFTGYLTGSEQAAYLNEFGQPLGDRYLDFLTRELKPFIDDNFRTRPEAAATFLLGSSMGGIISLYGMCRHPQQFGGAACLSTHWPACRGRMLAYLADHLPDPAGHRLYFDRGTEALEADYAPFQLRADRLLVEHGYQPHHCQSLTFAGADHSERSWRRRAAVPLRFLLHPPAPVPGASP